MSIECPRHGTILYGNGCTDSNCQCKASSSKSDFLCPLESIDCTLAFATKDWGLDKNDAWIYGIVAGWDDDSLAELQAKFRWTTETVSRLKKLHKAFRELRA